MHPITVLDDPADHERLLESCWDRQMSPHGQAPEMLVIAMEARRVAKKAVSELYEAQREKNALSAQFGERKKAGEPTDDLREAIAEVTAKIEQLEVVVRDNDKIVTSALATIPNMRSISIPVGDETANRIFPQSFHLMAIPEPEFDFPVKDHVEIGTKMGCMHFEEAAKMSGTRFVALSGALAKLERVLGQWMLDEAAFGRGGYREVSPPHLVKADAMYGTGQLPKFEDDLFKAGDHYLIPTAEVSLTNMVRDTIIEKDADRWADRMCALTPCYRAEAGSAGRDTRGLMRMHQFNKVELVTICDAESAYREHEHMLACAENVLVELRLPHRRVLLSTGDLGFSAIKTFDLEVWIPSEKRYREISSVSYCGDFQARRMNARWKRKGEKGTNFVHTLNGSGVAVGRALLAIMENYQTEQGGIAIPQVLRQRMGGSFIAPDGEIV